MLHLPKNIGLIGKAGHGKTTVARILAERYRYQITPFAKPLKDMMRQLGLSEEELNGSRKEIPSFLLCGKSPREAMQLLGAEWGRDLIGDGFWSRIWACQTEGRHVVADDVRYPNEIAAIQRRDGITIRVMRPGHTGTVHGTHSSECALDGFVADFVVLNNGTKSDLIAQVEGIIEEYSSARSADTTQAFSTAHAPSAAE